MAKTVLLVAPTTKYFVKVCSSLRKYLKGGKSLVYVTTNKPFANIENLLKKQKVRTKEIFFIDCISKAVGYVPEEEPDNCLFIKSPQQITALSLAINKAIKLMPGEKVLLFDSLSALLIYNNESTIGKFSNFLINKMKASNISIIMIALDSDADKKIVKTIESFVDEVI